MLVPRETENDPASRRSTTIDSRCGGAGSGKTTIALRKAVRRIDNGLSDGQFVLFLSFSSSAVFRIAQTSKIEAPVEKRQFLALHTFHSFCRELLRTHGYLL